MRTAACAANACNCAAAWACAAAYAASIAVVACAPLPAKPICSGAVCTNGELARGTGVDTAAAGATAAAISTGAAGCAGTTGGKSLKCTVSLACASGNPSTSASAPSGAVSSCSGEREARAGALGCKLSAGVNPGAVSASSIGAAGAESATLGGSTSGCVSLGGGGSSADVRGTKIWPCVCCSGACQAGLHRAVRAFTQRVPLTGCGRGAGRRRRRAWIGLRAALFDEAAAGGPRWAVAFDRARFLRAHQRELVAGQEPGLERDLAEALARLVSTVLHARSELLT